MQLMLKLIFARVQDRCFDRAFNRAKSLDSHQVYPDGHEPQNLCAIAIYPGGIFKRWWFILFLLYDIARYSGSEKRNSK